MCRKQTRLDKKVETESKDAASRGILSPYQDKFGPRSRKAATATCDPIKMRDVKSVEDKSDCTVGTTTVLKRAKPSLVPG